VPGISYRLQTQKHRSVWSIVSRNEIVALGRAKHQRMLVEPIRFAGSLAARKKSWRKPEPDAGPNPQLDGART
jgi:hypothetical protein